MLCADVYVRAMLCAMSGDQRFRIRQQNTALSWWDTQDTPKTLPGVQEDQFLITRLIFFLSNQTLVFLPKLDPFQCVLYYQI